MADLNKLRQTKEYQGSEAGRKYLDDLDPALEEGIKEMVEKQKEMNPSKYTKDDLEQAKCSIAEKILKHFDDTLFEMICEEMHQHYIFQSDNYLTEAGYDVFEDEWFEFYHEQHGDILHQIMQSLTN